MTSDTVLMHEQETRRQAMLQALQIDVWLPRQQLLHGAESREYLLNWQAQAIQQPDTVQPAAVEQPQPSKASAAVAVTERPAPAARPPSAYVSVHEKLAALQAQQAPVAPQAATVQAQPVAEVVADEETVVEPTAPADPIPRFALQLLRADNCLILADLPVGEPFQSRDPDYQLLKDMLLAAGLTDNPSFMRQGAPIAWPLLHSGSLMHEQNAAAARSCVRDLLNLELSSEPAVCIWLLGEQAVRFASATDDAVLYGLAPFSEGSQLWSLPSLESILQQPLLKRDIWRSMCEVRSLWQVQDDT